MPVKPNIPISSRWGSSCETFGNAHNIFHCGLTHHKPYIKSVYTVTKEAKQIFESFLLYMYSLQSRSVSADHRCSMRQDCRQRCSGTATAMGVSSRDQSSASSNRTVNEQTQTQHHASYHSHILTIQESSGISA